MLHSTTKAAQWLKAHVTGTLRTDSRAVQPGDAFIAWPGAAVDGRSFVNAALQAGAAVCLVESEGIDAFALPTDRVESFSGLKAATGPIAAEYFAHPSEEVAVLAVTGTNGKTSTAWWLAQALSALKGSQAIPCAMIGTLGVGRPPAAGAPEDAATAQGDVVSTGLTTPDPVQLQSALRRFAGQGIKACAIEASSIGIEEARLDGTQIRVALFTNFTQDHLDYHGSMEAYWQTKRRLFAWSGLHSVVLNLDDVRGVELASALETSGLAVWTVSTVRTARLQARNLVYRASGIAFDVVEGDTALPLQTNLIGSYNVSNLLGVLAAMRALGVPLADAVRACSQLHAVPGRMECLGDANTPLVAVDYAHTPDALDHALQALRPMVQARGGKLWCVFGCGGDRDASKRPLMGAIAAKLADQVVVTSDNPRSEKPEAIIAQILLGLPSCKTLVVQPDRAQAIAQTIQRAAAQDVVLLAGKGHEATQEIAGVKTAFSDRAHAVAALQHWRLVGAAGASTKSMMDMKAALQWLSGARLVGDGEVRVMRVHTDTRSVEHGDLFLALKGEKFDANTMLHEASKQGAAGLICHAGLAADSYPAGIPRIEVADTHAALTQLATGWRAQFSIPVVAVTGSNGKTTVTQMIASILQAAAGDDALATRGNLNNDIGVPLTVLRLRAHHRIAVVELGMNHPGEIEALAAIARPTVALVNNAQREHLEFMQTVKAVAEENGSVIGALTASGTAVFPADDDFTTLWAELAAPRRVARFALAATGNAQDLVCDKAQWVDGAWSVRASGMGTMLNFRLHIAGRHNVKNALAAAACALSAGVPVHAVVQGLEAFVPVKGRSRAVALTIKGRIRTLVDDTYNANPDSVRAAIAVLAELPAPRLLVLGDMGEVGEQGPAFHTEAGAEAKAAGIEHFYALGELAKSAVAAFPGARHFASIEDLNVAVLHQLPQVHSLLVKGSRFMRMERVVEAVCSAAQTQGTP